MVKKFVKKYGLAGFSCNLDFINLGLKSCLKHSFSIEYASLTLFLTRFTEMICLKTRFNWIKFYFLNRNHLYFSHQRKRTPLNSYAYSNFCKYVQLYKNFLIKYQKLLGYYKALFIDLYLTIKNIKLHIVKF